MQKNIGITGIDNTDTDNTDTDNKKALHKCRAFP